MSLSSASSSATAAVNDDGASAPPPPPPSSSPTSAAASSSSSPPPTTTSNANNDRVSAILAALDDPTLDTLPAHLRMSKYEDGFDFDKLDEQLQAHPFFMTEMPDPSKPLPPLIEAFQQLKYSETENTQHELAVNHKEDGVFHFKLKKYRLASMCFTTALSHELKQDDPESIDKELVASLYNNRSACMWYLRNYGSCIRDCESAIKYQHGYVKALKRAILAAEALGRWADVDRFCTLGESQLSDSGDPIILRFFCEKRAAARRGKSSLMAEERKRAVASKCKEADNDRILKLIKERGLRLRNEGFLEGEVAVNEGRVVRVVEEGVQECGGRGGGSGDATSTTTVASLAWPVLFMYPQYGQSDFVEQFHEEDEFSVHVSEMLEVDRPGWDTSGEFTPNNVDVFYLSESSCSLVPVPPTATLLEVMQAKDFWVPGNGVPSFFVLAKNQFSQDFIERVGGR